MLIAVVLLYSKYDAALQWSCWIHSNIARNVASPSPTSWQAPFSQCYARCSQSCWCCLVCLVYLLLFSLLACFGFHAAQFMFCWSCHYFCWVHQYVVLSTLYAWSWCFWNSPYPKVDVLSFVTIFGCFSKLVFQRFYCVTGLKASLLVGFSCSCQFSASYCYDAI